MSQAESNLSRKIMKRLRLEGWFCFKVHGSETMMSGLPDIIVCAEGKFIGLETKMPDKRENTSTRQEYVHDLIRLAGGIASVVWSEEQAVEVVRRALS
jgi:Holliday junction resolvase